MWWSPIAGAHGGSSSSAVRSDVKRQLDTTRAGLYGQVMPRTIGQFLKALRQSQDLSLREAAAGLGWNHQHLAGLEGGAWEPGDDQALALARYYRVKLGLIYARMGRLAPSARRALMAHPELHDRVERVLSRSKK